MAESNINTHQGEVEEGAAGEEVKNNEASVTEFTKLVKCGHMCDVLV